MSDDDLRAALRSVTEPVVLVPDRGVAGPSGLTVGSFASVSADPPLVLSCPARPRARAEMAPSGRVAVHVSDRDQADLALRFADRVDRFAGGSRGPRPGRSPGARRGTRRTAVPSAHAPAGRRP